MKNLTLLFLFLYSFQLSSQVPYTPFDLENSIWEESDGALWFVFLRSIILVESL
ncbi:MAG: hypothetical protein ACJAT4_001418 [Granulosicoccus sp.]|jgi:hypothetical protein